MFIRISPAVIIFTILLCFAVPAMPSAVGLELAPPVSGNAAASSSVAVDGSSIVLGAPFDEPKGAVYVYVKTSHTWGLGQKIPAPATAANVFGISVSLAGDLLLAGSGGR